MDLAQATSANSDKKFRQMEKESVVDELGTDQGQLSTPGNGVASVGVAQSQSQES